MQYVKDAYSLVVKQGEKACRCNAIYCTAKLKCRDSDYLESVAWLWAHNNFNYPKFYQQFGYVPNNNEWQITLRCELYRLVEKYVKTHVLY